MVRCGLVHEMAELYELERSYLGDRPDFLKGIWKTIGYKEFYLYLSGGKKGSGKALEKAIEDTKIKSVFYAKLQWDWIQKEVCPALEDMSIPFIDMQATSKEDIKMVGTTYVLDFFCHFLALPFRFSAQTLPLFAH
jgi:tRNA A37 N6-isopentenylltransferase MiaA